MQFQGWEYRLRSHSAAGRVRDRRSWPSRPADQRCRGPRWIDPRPANWRSPDPDPKELESANPGRRDPEQGKAPLPRRKGSRLRVGSIWLSSASLAWRGSRLPPSDCKGWPQSPAGVTLNHGMPLRRGFCPPPFGALNSAVECHLHTVEVAGSNPAAPTNIINNFKKPKHKTGYVKSTLFLRGGFLSSFRHRCGMVHERVQEPSWHG